MELISFGDPMFMSSVLRGVQLMSSAGTFMSLGSIGLLVGLLLMGIQGMSKSQIDLGGWGTSLILFLVMFGVRTDVIVVEKTPGWGRTALRTPQVIADVPFGVAAMGWFTSQTGYRLSQRMEAAFYVPADGGSAASLLQGFGKTLEVLALVREAQYPTITGGNDADSTYLAYRKSVVAYMGDCTAAKLAMTPDLAEKMLQAPEPFDLSAMGFDSQSHLTTNYVADGAGNISGTQVTCLAQASGLQARGTSAFESFYSGMMARLTPSGGNMQTTATDSYAALGMMQADAQRYVVAHIVKGSLREAVQAGFSGHEARLRIMVDEAAMQRASQFAGEESMFLRMARPMIAFFETVVYIAAPFMALAVGFGRVGQGMVIKYALLTVWVTLWMPTLAALNLFSQTMARNAIEASINTVDAAGRKTVGSIEGAEVILGQVEDWLGTAALLMASTPAITLMLIFGSAMTAVGLANRVQGADTINEKTPTPDALGTAPAISAGSLGSSNAQTGYASTGAAKLGIGSSEGRTAAVQQASQEAAMQEQAFTQQFGARAAEGFRNSMVQAMQSGNEQKMAQTLAGMDNFMAKSGQSSNWERMSTMERGAALAIAGNTVLGGEVGFDAGKIAKMLGAKAAQGGGGKDGSGAPMSDANVPAGPIALGGRWGGSTENREAQTFDQKAVQRAAEQMVAGWGRDQGTRAEAVNALTQTLSQTGRAEQGQTAELVNSADFQKAARELNTATQSYAATQAASSALSATTEADRNQIAASVAKSPEAMEGLRKAVSEYGGGADAVKEAQYRAQSAEFANYGSSPGHREALALMDNLMGGGQIQGGSQHADDRLRAVVGAANEAGVPIGGGSMAPPTNQLEGSGPGGPPVEPGSVEKAVNSNLDPINFGAVSGQAQAGIGGAEEKVHNLSGADGDGIAKAGERAATVGTDPTNFQGGSEFDKGVTNNEGIAGSNRDALATNGASQFVNAALATNEDGLTDNVTGAQAGGYTGYSISNGPGFTNMEAMTGQMMTAMARPDDVKPEMAQVAAFQALVNHHDSGSSFSAVKPSSEQVASYEAALAKLDPEERVAAQAMADTTGKGPALASEFDARGGHDMPATTSATTAMSRIADMDMSEIKDTFAPYGMTPKEGEKGESKPMSQENQDYLSDQMDRTWDPYR